MPMSRIVSKIFSYSLLIPTIFCNSARAQYISFPLPLPCNMKCVETIKMGKMSPGQVAQLVGASSHARKSCGSIPGHGTYQGCGLDHQSGHVQEAIKMYLSHQRSPTSSLPPASLSRINNDILGWEFLKMDEMVTVHPVCVYIHTPWFNYRRANPKFTGFGSFLRTPFQCFHIPGTPLIRSVTTKPHWPEASVECHNFLLGKWFWH